MDQVVVVRAALGAVHDRRLGAKRPVAAGSTRMRELIPGIPLNVSFWDGHESAPDHWGLWRCEASTSRNRYESVLARRQYISDRYSGTSRMRVHSRFCSVLREREQRCIKFAHEIVHVRSRSTTQTTCLGRTQCVSKRCLHHFVNPLPFLPR